jgi:hypothetical protein
MAALEELLNGQPGRNQLDVENRTDVLPEVCQYRGCQVFRTGHGRSCRRHLLQHTTGGCRHGGLDPAVPDARQRAKHRHMTGAQLPPLRERRRQNRADLVGTQR